MTVTRRQVLTTVAGRRILMMTWTGWWPMRMTLLTQDIQYQEETNSYGSKRLEIMFRPELM